MSNFAYYASNSTNISCTVKSCGKVVLCMTQSATRWNMLIKNCLSHFSMKLHLKKIADIFPYEIKGSPIQSSWNIIPSFAVSVSSWSFQDENYLHNDMLILICAYTYISVTFPPKIIYKPIWFSFFLQYFPRLAFVLTVYIF